MTNNKTVNVPVDGFNGCFRQAVKALRYLAENTLPEYEQESYISEHLYQIADELEKTLQAAPKPVEELLPDAWQVFNPLAKRWSLVFSAGDVGKVEELKEDGYEIRPLYANTRAALSNGGGERWWKFFECDNCKAMYLEIAPTVCDCAHDATEFTQRILAEQPPQHTKENEG